MAISSHQGLCGVLRVPGRTAPESGARHVRVYGGDGGVIVAAEIIRLAKAGSRIFSPENGQRLGLPGMLNELIRDCDVDLAARRRGPTLVSSSIPFQASVLNCAPDC